MIFTMEEVGKLFLKQNDVIGFKKEFDKLYSLADFNNMYLFEYFNTVLQDRSQFESFIVGSVVLLPDSAQKAKPILNFVGTYCLPLALKINFILWVLNNYKYNNKILKLIDLPYSNIFERINKNCHLDDDELKKVFEKLFSKNDELFNLILKLRDDFQNSKIFNNYINLSKINDSESEYYIKAIKSHFYIIKQIIFEIILHGDIQVYDENNILKFFESISAEGKIFDMKLIHASIKNKNIIKIDYEDSQNYAFISSTTIKNSKKKGMIIGIKGEFINNGFGKYSKNMDFCSEKIDKLKEFFVPNKDYEKMILGE